jgi:penicillin-binding protein 1A
MQDVMTGPLDYGTAAGYDIPCPAAGKTGTTETNADAWFIGYTPHVSTAVWVGNPNSRLPLPGYGGTLAAPIWQDYMMVAASQPCDDFPEPENPASLSPYYGDLTSSSSDSDYGDTTTTTADDTTSTDEPGGVTTPDDGDYDPDLYAPGAGQDPLPEPGGDQGGGPPGGSPPGNGGGPPTDTGGATP